MKYLRRAMAIMLSFILVTGSPGLEVLAETLSPDRSPQTISYVDASGVAQTAENCLPVTANMHNGWFAVTEDTEIDGWIWISGAVNLILCDGKTLKANEGIHVAEDSSLTIWAQSVYTEDSNTGKLVSVGQNSQAGIGSAYGNIGGAVVINGGNIDSSSNSTNSINAPGIGGSTIVINGGKVNARSQYGAAIGSAQSGECGDITINGGEVHAESSESGAGIGTGTEGSVSGSVTINGGTVTAKSRAWGAGIGGGNKSRLNSITITGGTVNAFTKIHGAAIGGGSERENCTITISGGNVTATNEYSGAAIGSGEEADSGDITITGNAVVNALNKLRGAAIGAGECANASGTITINGNAKVTATNWNCASGIGGGWSMGSKGNLNGFVIIGGNATVTARGGSGCAGIGGGREGNARDGHVYIGENATVYAYGGEGAAGIGGGREVSGNYGIGGDGCGDVRIDGSATVFAQSGEGSCSAIGHGDDDEYMGNIAFGRGLSVKAGNERDDIDGTYEGLFSAGLREAACQWRHKALIRPCDHPEENIHYVHISTRGHLRDTCSYCEKLFMEEDHVFDDTGKCTSCGYEYEGELVTISFNSNGGSGTMDSFTYMPESFYTLPECRFSPPTGKTFHGWLITAAGTGAEDPVSGIHFPYETILLPGGGTVELKANWEGDTTMTISPGEGMGEEKTAYLSMGEKYPLPTPETVAFTGPQWYSFAGWRINNDAENLKQPLEPITIEGDTVITAVWTRATRTVTFDTNGGSAVPAKTLQNGETVVKPDDPTRNDDTFQGWYLDDEAFDFTTPITGDLTLTARWLGPWGRLQQQIDNAASGDTVALTGNVTADSDDVPILIDSEKNIVLDLNGYTINRALTEACSDGNVITVKGTLTLTDSSSGKTGKITGGNNTLGGGGIIVSAGGSLMVNSGTITGNRTDGEGGGVYNEGTFKLSGDPKITGNTAGGADGNVYLNNNRITIVNPLTSGALVGVKMKTPGIITSGYKTYNEGSAPSEFFISDDTGFIVTLTEDGEAQLAYEVFTVTFYDGLGETLKTDTVKKGSSAIPPADPKRDGYAFKGWDTDFSKVTSDLTVRAKWKQDIMTHNVTFEDGMGNILTTQTIVDGRSATAPEDPARDGFIFSGWDTDFGSVKRDLTVKARWTEKSHAENKYTVVFVIGFGNDPVSVEVDKGGSATAPSVPLVDGFTFTGWDKEFTNVNENLAVTAKWKKNTAENEHTVTFVDGYSGKPPLRIQRVKDGESANPPATPTREGYIFDGWDTDFSYVTANMTVIAQWKQEKKEEPEPDDKDFGIYFAELFDDPYEGVCYNSENGHYEVIYTGAAITPLIKVTSEADGELREGIDYTVSYSNNKNVSKQDKPATIRVNGKGFYKSKKVLELYILPADLEEANSKGLLAGAAEFKVLNGSKLNPMIVYRGYKLAGRDRDIINKNKITGDTTTDVTGRGNFTGTLNDVSVKVISKDDRKNGVIKVNLKAAQHVYNGGSHKLSVTTADAVGELTVTAGSSKTPLIEDTDFVVSYSGNTSAGKATVTITGIGKYSGTVVKNFTIQPDKTIDITAELADPASVFFNVRGAKPDIKVTAHRKAEDDTVTDEVLVEGRDYKVSYSSNKKAGKGAYTVKFTGNYNGHKAVKGTFDIERASISTAKVEAMQMIYKNPGNYLSKPFVSIDGVQLKTSDYTYKYYLGEEEITSSYKLSLEDGETSKTVRIVVTGKGNYTDTTAEGTYEVVRRGNESIDLTKAKIVAKDKVKGKDVSVAKQEYNGYAIEPEIRVMAKINKVWTDVDPKLYDVSYINNVNKGTATILVSGNGTETIGSRTAGFSINTMRFELFELIFRKCFHGQ